MLALRAAAVALATTCALAFGATSAGARPSPSPMVDQINQIRMWYGLHSLRYSPTLSRSSSRYVRYLMRTNQFAHTSRIRASSRFSKLGEVLAVTPSWEINRTRTLVYWLWSPSHRAVLLSRSFRHIGTARVHGYLAGRQAVLWAVQVGQVRKAGA